MSKKRILAKLLVIVMLLVLFPVPQQASAAGGIYWPVPGHTGLSRGYSSGHKAIDIWDPSINGAPVVNAMGGKVFAIYQCTQQHYGTYGDCNGFGTGLVIQGDDGRFYQYCHMQAGSIPPAYRQRWAYISGGAQIGRVGTTGNSTGPHLHFGISSSLPWGKLDVNPENETYWNGGISSSMSWVNFKADNVTKSNAVVRVRAVPSSPNKFFEIGVYLYDKTGKQIGHKQEMADPSARSYLDIFYDINGELGVTLRPGNTYSVKFYATCNGKRHTSDAFTFTTQPCSSHSFGSWSTVTQATCGKNGLQKRVCSACGKEETRSIPATGKHVYSNDQDTTCNVCGHVRQVDQIDQYNQVDVYRLYNSNTSEHLYCTDKSEINFLSRHGWRIDGKAWSSPANTGREVYRLYNPADGSHLYTMDDLEIKKCILIGWKVDGPVCYSASANGTPIYRLYNPNKPRHYHLYTIDRSEIQHLTRIGWKLEGIAWYASK